jgi:hypothetical protein
MVATLTFALTLASPAIDFDHHPAPAPVIVEALAKKLGRNLVADEDLSVDILIVHLDDADPDNALEWIAEAIEGEWKEDGDKLRLTRSHETELRQEREDLAERLRQIKARLNLIPETEPLDKPSAGLLAQLAKTAFSDRSITVYDQYELFSRAPGFRFAARVAKALDFEQFLSLPPGTSVWLPFDGKKIDPRLSSEVRRLLADYEKEDRLYASELRSAGFIYDTPTTYGGALPGRWEKGSIAAAVHVTNNFGYLDVDIELAWGALESGETIRPIYPQGQVGLESIAPRTAWNAPITVDPLTADFLTLMAPRQFVEAPTRVPQSVQNYFANDPTFDLFGVGTSTILVQAAQLTGKSLVACLPDTSSYAVRRLISAPSQTIQQIMDRIASPSLVKLKEGDEVLVLSPRMPHQTRQERLPRNIVQKIVRDASRGSSDVSIYADLVAKSDPGISIPDPRQTYAVVTRLIHLNGDSSNMKEQTVRLYGSLTPAQRNAAASSELVLPWNSLNNSQKSAWIQAINSTARIGSLIVRDSHMTTDGKTVVPKEVVLRQKAQSQLPTALVVQIRDTQVLAASSSTNSSVPWQVVEGRSLISMVASKELGLQMWEVDKFALLPMRRITVLCEYGPERFEVGTFSEAYGPEALTPFPYSEIPERMIESNREEIEKTKKAFRNIPPD